MFPPNGVPLRNEQGVPLPNGPLLTRLRPVPGHPLAALYAPVQQEPGAQGMGLLCAGASRRSGQLSDDTSIPGGSDGLSCSLP